MGATEMGPSSMAGKCWGILINDWEQDLEVKDQREICLVTVTALERSCMSSGQMDTKERGFWSSLVLRP